MDEQKIEQACKHCGGAIGEDGLALVLAEDASGEHELPESEEEGAEPGSFADALASRKAGGEAPKGEVVVEVRSDREKPKVKRPSDYFTGKRK